MTEFEEVFGRVRAKVDEMYRRQGLETDVITGGPLAGGRWFAGWDEITGDDVVLVVFPDLGRWWALDFEGLAGYEEGSMSVYELTRAERVALFVERAAVSRRHWIEYRGCEWEAACVRVPPRCRWHPAGAARRAEEGEDA